jgi:hypothetical protein
VSFGVWAKGAYVGEHGEGDRQIYFSNSAGAPDASDRCMQSHACELVERAGRFKDAVGDLANHVTDTPSARKIVKSLTATSSAIPSGYKDACASSSPEQFISRISAVARSAKKAKAALVLLVQLDHISIQDAREAILEARALEAIFVASRNTAKKRARGRMAPRRNPSERAAEASDGKPARRRQNPRGVT